MEQMETVQRLAGCSFGVGGVPFWGKLKARVFNPPSTADEALRFIDELRTSPTCEVAFPETGFLDRLGTVVRESGARGNLVFDAQIAALCGEHGITAILTNDHDFERFPRLKVSYLH